jgi:hypothetical protein
MTFARALPASENVFICSPGLVSLVSFHWSRFTGLNQRPRRFGELAVTLCNAPFLFEFLCQLNRFFAQAGDIEGVEPAGALYSGRGAISSVVDGQRVGWWSSEDP